METETKQAHRVYLDAADDTDAELGVTAWLVKRYSPRSSRAVSLTDVDLRAIVQQAYDVHGIAADPFATPGSADL